MGAEEFLFERHAELRRQAVHDRKADVVAGVRVAFAGVPQTDNHQRQGLLLFLLCLRGGLSFSLRGGFALRRNFAFHCGRSHFFLRLAMGHKANDLI